MRQGEEVPLTAIKVPYTVGSKLLKSFQAVTRKHGIPIKFIETSGYSLQNLLEKSDPFRGRTCGRPECFPCSSGGTGRCDKIGGGYRITCEEDDCAARGVRYEGESALPCYRRGLEHKRGYDNKEKENVLWKHAKNEHDGRSDVNYKMQVLKTYGTDNTTRKGNEAVRIATEGGELLNSKAEYRQPSIPRLVMRNSSNEK